jgi:hypothetical protein
VFAAPIIRTTIALMMEMEKPAATNRLSNGTANNTE